jgi:hypothetical protein
MVLTTCAQNISLGVSRGGGKRPMCNFYNEVISEKLTCPQLVRKFAAFLHPKGLLPHSQEILLMFGFKNCVIKIMS